MYEITQYVRNNTIYQSTGKKGIRIEKKNLLSRSTHKRTMYFVEMRITVQASCLYLYSSTPFSLISNINIFLDFKSKE